MEGEFLSLGGVITGGEHTRSSRMHAHVSANADTEV
jgi:hypothetical protein